MSLNRYDARRDVTEKAIVAALRTAGAQVIFLHPFDLLVRFRQQIFLLDCKRPQGKATVAQQAMIDAGWPLTLVETPESALRAIGAIP